MNNQIFSPYSPPPFMHCPNDNSHKRFITGAVICQDWLVDGNGNFIEVTDECTQVFYKPSTENEWSCADCGSTGVSRNRFRE